MFKIKMDLPTKQLSVNYVIMFIRRGLKTIMRDDAPEQPAPFSRHHRRPARLLSNCPYLLYSLNRIVSKRKEPKIDRRVSDALFKLKEIV